MLAPLLVPVSPGPLDADPHGVDGGARRRDRVYRIVTRALAVALVPVAFAVAPRRARHVACQWALAARFPAEDLTGLTPGTRAAFEAARARALWRDGELIGLTDGYRDGREQARLFAEEVRRTGSVEAARRWILPPGQSRHVTGTALDVRPAEGARWLERYGARYHLYRLYDNEWWHFEYRPEGAPERLPHPGADLPGVPPSGPREGGRDEGGRDGAGRDEGGQDGGMRLVSLLPSATEIVYALGLDDQLVGVTFECDHPPAARTDKAVVVGGRDTRGMSPGDIDDYVKAALSAGEDLYTLRADALAGLDPELILTQDLCRVCALPSGHVSDALGYLGCRADVLSLDPYTLDEVLGTIVAVGERAGVPDRAAALVAGLRARLAAVASAVRGLPRPRVAVVEWVDPPFTSGHWVPDLVRAAGGEPVAARPGARSTQTTWQEFTDAAPDVVLVTPCGFHVEGAARQARTVVDRFPGTPVWALDADGIVVRPGPRLVDGVEAIAAILHPGAVPEPPAGAALRVA